MNNDVVFVFVEMAFQIITLVLGGVIVFRARDNRLHLFWGAMTVFTSVVLLVDNVEWIHRMMPDVMDNFYLLKMNRLLKWFLMAHFYTLFPLAALRPGYMDLYRISFVSIPLIVVGTFGGAYDCFVGKYTVLICPNDVVAFWDSPDVKLRVGIFTASAVFPILNTCYVMRAYYKHSIRSFSSGFQFYSVLSVLQLLLYCLFCWMPTPAGAMMYGVSTAFFLLSISLLIIRDENPFTNPPTTEARRKMKEQLWMVIKGEKNFAMPVEPTDSTKNTMPPERYFMAEELRVYRLLSQYMEEKKPYLDPNFEEFNVLKELQAKHQVVVSVIQYEGFTSFREYVSYYRIEHFKRLARQTPGASIKQLIFDSGFQSRATFYRNFENFEAFTPKEFIASLEDASREEA